MKGNYGQTVIRVRNNLQNDFLYPHAMRFRILRTVLKDSYYIRGNSFKLEDLAIQMWFITKAMNPNRLPTTSGKLLLVSFSLSRQQPEYPYLYQCMLHSAQFPDMFTNIQLQISTWHKEAAGKKNILESYQTKLLQLRNASKNPDAVPSGLRPCIYEPARGATDFRRLFCFPAKS